MSYNKLNVFHWHVVDSQSFPIEVESLPQFGKAAYSPEMMYSRSDVEEIIIHAYKRGIRVIPEFDMPGHTYCWGLAFPEITACMGSNWMVNAAEPPAGQLDPTNSLTYQIIGQLIEEMSNVFTDEYWHIGGDEVNFNCWNSSETIVEYMQSHNINLVDLVHLFESQVTEIVKSNNKDIMVWEEMVLDFNVTFPSDTLVQVWRGSQNVAQVAEKNYQIVVSSSDYWYLDCGHGDWISGGTSWCDPFKTWQNIYSYDICQNITSDQCANLIKGGEICLWSEQSDENNLEVMLWQRSSAAAEVLWSGSNKDESTAIGRLTDMRFRLVKRGIRAEPLQPLFCAQNPSLCNN